MEFTFSLQEICTIFAHSLFWVCFRFRSLQIVCKEFEFCTKQFATAFLKLLESKQICANSIQTSKLQKNNKIYSKCTLISKFAQTVFFTKGLETIISSIVSIVPKKNKHHQFQPKIAGGLYHFYTFNSTLNLLL